MKLIDTGVAVDHLRGEQQAVELMRRLIGDDELVAASELVRFELVSGVRQEEIEALEQFFSALVWIAVDEEIARTAGSLARTYRRAHSGIDDVDYVIAATALVLEADLLTTNGRHFPMFPELRVPY